MIENLGGGVYLYTADGVLENKDRLSLAAAEYFSATGISPRKIIKAPSGKPSFEGEGLYLSPSHTASFYAVAFAPFPIGLDLEKEEIEKDRVREKYFTLIEKKLPFSLVWTVKEAVAKLTGEGLSAVGRVFLAGDAPEARLDGEKYQFSSFTENGLRFTLARRKRKV